VTSSLSLLIGQTGSNAALATFLIYIAGVFGLAWLSNRLLQKKSFLSEYFLGSRNLGVWAFALTFAATSSSGGSFTGFPSKIYTHGWILGLWIGSYIVVPICAMGILGKRLNQVARISGAITVTDVLRDRFRSPMFGLLAVSLLVFFMAFNLVAQFKSGSEILKTLLQDVNAFNQAVGWLAGITADLGLFTDVDPAYLLCLGTFAIAVIVYTTYGGFHAVVWTDVLQGIVMVFGVLIMLPLAIWQVGGLNGATREMAEMVPPRVGFAEVRLPCPLAEDFAMSSPWFALEGEPGRQPRLFRVSRTLALPADVERIRDVKVVEIVTPEEIQRQLTRLREQTRVSQFNARLRDLLQSQLRWISRQPQDDEAERVKARRQAAQLRAILSQVDRNRTALLGAPGVSIVEFRIETLQDYVYGADRPGVYVTGPGPAPPQLPDRASEMTPIDRQSSLAREGFLPLSLAISFFFMWAISGTGQPSTMVRLMAFRNTATLRRAIFTVAIYYSMIYFPLVIIFCCARIVLPGMDLESDRIMPQMAVTLTSQIGQGWLAGLLVAAPFAAVMSTVDSFLLIISSALVRDIYQRNLNPGVKDKTIKRLSYLFTVLVGLGATLGAINPPQFLQDLVVYTGSGLAACFLAPMVFALYWPRANVFGCISGMALGFAAHLALYLSGIFVNGSFYQPYRMFNMDPIVFGLFVSFVAVYVVSRWTKPPPEDLVRKYFCRECP
jgi:Na+/pantothenate symporter